MTLPRITLRPGEVAAMHRDGPVALVKIYVALEDWQPFMQVAYAGMELPVSIEGSSREGELTAILHAADERDGSISVVI